MDVIFVLVCVVPVARCYSSGQVQASCVDMQPHHSGSSPQTSPAPFTVTADQTSYRDGEEITGSTPFAGFMLQAREVGGIIPLGSFSVSDEEAAQLLTCNGAPNSAVSHTSEASKTSIQGTWRAASGNTNSIEFHASFVRDYTTFWVGVKSPSLEYNVGSSDSPTANSTSIPITTSITASTTAQTSLPPAQTISSAGCGVKKVCFSQPLNCDPAVSVNCYFMSALMTSPSATAVQLELTGPAPGYVSFGFSDDKRMGNDDIYICGLDSNGFVQVQHAFSTGRRAPQIISLGNVSDVKASVQDGIISCSFTSMNPISTQRTTGFNSPYFLIFAHGPTSNGQIRFHTSTFISDDKVDISSPQLVTNAKRPNIIKAHGALMLIAWMTTGTLGMITARYLKSVAKGHGFWGKDVWFLAHVSLMSLTVAATIIGFILSFSHVRVWSGGVHPVLGCLVMILSFFQPIVAIFRCGPHHQLRFLFNWSHALNAVAIKGLAVAAIFTGLKLIDSTRDKWLMKVMGGFVGWEALFYILLDLHTRWKKKDTDDPNSKTESIDLTILALFCLGNLTFLVALLVGIGMS